MKRPHTAGDFRTRRYRQRSVEEPVQVVDILHHDADNDGGKVTSHLNYSRQPDHLSDINGQHQDIHSLKETASISYDTEHVEKKPPKK